MQITKALKFNLEFAKGKIQFIIFKFPQKSLNFYDEKRA